MFAWLREGEQHTSLADPHRRIGNQPLTSRVQTVRAVPHRLFGLDHWYNFAADNSQLMASLV
jgi:hypothetical protein